LLNKSFTNIVIFYLFLTIHFTRHCGLDPQSLFITTVLVGAYCIRPFRYQGVCNTPLQFHTVFQGIAGQARNDGKKEQ